ncbi:MAG: hypothetical protein K940chlam7_01952, partial [Chlamydiae bacterium]|nr:hypothetical protein [Chlamydiota bacterium]
VTAKIEILRTMLYGSGLEEMPSIRRFKAFVDLANSRAESIVDATGYSEEIATLEAKLQGTGLDKSARQKKEERLVHLKEKVEQWESAGLKAREETVGSDTFTVWSAPESYLFFGCADTPSGITGFADQLLESEYYETLCTSAITEDTGFFKEEERLFLMMHINPDTIVHAQERDLRSPRFSEDKNWQRTEWYDLARRNIRLTGEIDSAHRAFVGVCLPHLFGEEPTTDPVSTDIDRFNRLTIQMATLPDEKKKIAQNSYLSKKQAVSEYKTQELLSSFKSDFRWEELETSFTDLRLTKNTYDTPEKTFSQLSFEGQKSVLERVLFQQLSRVLEPARFQELKNALDYDWYCNCLQETLALLERVTAEDEWDDQLLDQLELLSKLQGEIDPSQRILSKRQQEALEKLHMIQLKKYFENVLAITHAWSTTSLQHGLEFISSDLDTEDPKEFKENLRGEIQKLKERIGDAKGASDWYQTLNTPEVLRMIKNAQPDRVFESLIQEDGILDDAGKFMQKRQVLRNMDLRQEAEEFGEFVEAYREVRHRLQVFYAREKFCDRLESLPDAQKTSDVKRAIAVLRHKEKPLSLEEVRKLTLELSEKACPNNERGNLIDLLDGNEKNMWFDSGFEGGVDKLQKKMEKESHILNRSRLQISNLIDWITEREEKLEGDENLALRKEVFTTLFGEDDPSEKYDILQKLRTLEEGLRALPRETGRRPDRTWKFFSSAPERLMGPQEAALQTHKALSDAGFDWNEINLDLEASGGQRGGAYPIGLLLSRKMIEGSQPPELEQIFAYARKKGLPIFVK